MGQHTIKLQCEMDAAGDALFGTASRIGGEIYEFTGWLGLLGVLQAMLAAEPDDARIHTPDCASTATDPSEGGNE